EIFNDTAITLGQAGEPGQEVQFETHDLVGRRLRVVQQGLAQRMLRERLKLGKPANVETVPSLGHWRQDIVGPFLTGNTSTASHGAGGIGRESGGKGSGILAFFGQTQVPPPRQSNHVLDGVLTTVRTFDVAKTYASVGQHSWQDDGEEGGVE